MEISKREIIVSVLILSLLVSMGLGIKGCIEDDAQLKLEIYTKAFKPEDEIGFQYGAATSIGSTLAFGTLIADQPVSHENIDGNYFILRANREHYTMHTYVTVDSKGNATTHTYWSWDTVSVDTLSTSTYVFLGVSGQTKDLSLYLPQLSIYKIDGDDRIVFSGLPSSFEATLLVDLRDNQITPGDNGVRIHMGQSVEQVITSLQKSTENSPRVFVWVWGVLSVIGIAVFIYQENDWLHF